MSEAVLEVLRFAGAPVSADVALLELEGIFAEHAPRGHERARLLLECAEESLELAPAAVARLPEGIWRASYAVPLALAGGSVYSLAVGRDLLLDLPAPDVTATAGGPATHHVRLAREANELRRRLDEAETVRNEATAAAETAAAAEAAERGTRVELEAARERDAATIAELSAAREQAETALAEAGAEGERRETAAREAAEQELAAVRGALEQELTAAREQAARERTTAQEETDRRLEGQQADAERRVEEAIAAERARASVTSHELRSARAEIEQLRRELGVRRTAGRRASPNGDGKDEEITARRVHEPEDQDATRRVEPVAATAATKAVPAREGEGEDETVRVLNPRASRPRHRLEDETEPASLPPGAAETGARAIEGSGVHASSTRALAFAALAVAVLAALLVIVARVGIL